MDREEVIIHCGSDLSAFWHKMQDYFPKDEMELIHVPGYAFSVRILKKHLAGLAPRMAYWIHKKISMSELQNLLTKLALEEEEKSKFFFFALSKLGEEENALCSLLEEKLNLFFCENSEFFMEGFLRFAIWEYRENVIFLLDDCFDEFAAQQEYYEFLELLHYFVETETPRFEDLTVSIHANKEIQFYDRDGADITTLCKKRFIEEFQDNAPDTEDFIMSTLILYLPQQIWIYGSQFLNNKNFFVTLRHIFGERVQIYGVPLRLS